MNNNEKGSTTTQLTELERLSSLKSLNVLDTKSDSIYNGMVETAAAVCDVPISLISLIDTNRQWFKANIGLPGLSETPREIAFCDHVLRNKGMLEIPNTATDSRFAANPLVTGAPGIGFYAGVPLQLSDGAIVGTLCVLDHKPKHLNDDQRQILHNLANATTRLLESRRLTATLTEERTRLSAIIEGTGAGTWEWNVQTGEFRTDKRYREISGQPNSDWTNINQWNSLLHPDDLNHTALAQEKHFHGKSQRYEFEARIKGSARQWQWVIDSGQIVSYTADGHAEWIYGTRLNINERKMQAEELKYAHERIKLATESGKIGVWDWNISTNLIDWNNQMYVIYDLDINLQRQIGKVSFDQWLCCIHPDDRKPVQEVLEHTLATSDHYDSDYRLLCADGSICHLRSTGKVKRNKNGQVTHVLGITWDVSALRRLSTELSEQHDLLRVTLKSIRDAIITTDAAGRVNWLNPAAEKLTGWTGMEAHGLQLEQVFNIINEETRKTAASPMEICRNTGAANEPSNHSILISKNGNEFTIEDSVAPIKNHNGSLLGIVLTFRDVTEKRKLSVEMNYRATHDPLTNLINRSEFENRLSQVFNNTRQNGLKSALMYIDLDRFKLVNDSCGHTVGDELLQKVSTIFARHVRKSDTLARIGGDEFAIILENCSSDHAHRIALKICRSVSNFRFTHNGKRLRIGTSIGLVPIDDHWENMESVLQAADSSCYAAKRAGRNSVQIWHNTDIRTRRDDPLWASRLEEALDQQQFELHAQRIDPVSATDSGLHAEVLIRMRNNQGELVAPEVFLPSAERFQMAARIDRWVLSHAIELLAASRNLSNVSLLFINLSGQSVGDRAFHHSAIDLLTRAGQDICQRLCLEITETVAVTNIADATNFIKRVRELGVRIALDDFGTGASSFGYLKKLNVDILKIDGQFITGLINDPLDDATVRCFIQVARILGIKTVAEFVNTPQILKKTREIGIHYAQGFLLHRPQPINDILNQPLLEFQPNQSHATLAGIQA